MIRWENRGNDLHYKLGLERDLYLQVFSQGKSGGPARSSKSVSHIPIPKLWGSVKKGKFDLQIAENSSMKNAS
jgi:hypothetical protein